MNFEKIYTYGTLRLDITIPYDFADPLTIPEIKLPSCDHRIGGSVYNTSRFLANNLCTDTIEMIVAGGGRLLAELKTQCDFPQNLYFLGDATLNEKYPVSIIGVSQDGEKRMVSYDPPATSDINICIENLHNGATIFYTSFYEITPLLCNSFEQIAWQKDNNSIIMVDLCPIIDNLDKSIIDRVLNCIQVITGNNSEFSALMHMLQIDEAGSLMLLYPNIKEIWIKKGEKGACVLTQDVSKKHIIYSCSVSKKVKAKNTTGCGDVFNAMVLFGKMRGYHYEEILKKAVFESSKIAEGELPWKAKV